VTAAAIVAIAVTATVAAALLLAAYRHGLFARHTGTHRRTARPGTRQAELIDMATVRDIPVMRVTPDAIDQLRDTAAHLLAAVEVPT